jgi:hypothetical protein
MGNVSEGNAVIKRLDGKDKGGRKLRLMRLAQKMIVGGAFSWIASLIPIFIT